MDKVLLCLVAWVVFSFPCACLCGQFIKAGRGWEIEGEWDE
jgi:hypothetical protein